MIILTMSALPARAFLSEYITKQTDKLNALYGYRVGPGTPKMDRPILRVFSTDGCSSSPNSYFDKNFVECCVQHDIDYWIGGTREQKVASDNRLNQCIYQKTKSKEVADVYHGGVVLGGEAWAPNTFRWGYGWDRLRDYSPITKEEKTQAETLYGKDLVLLRQMVAANQFPIRWEVITLDSVSMISFYDDTLVYYFLQNNLKRNDVVTFGSKRAHGLTTFSYEIGLQSCAENRIVVRIDTRAFWKDIFKIDRGIHRMPWSDLQKYIVSVNDPSHCLQGPGK